MKITIILFATVLILVYGGFIVLNLYVLVSKYKMWKDLSNRHWRPGPNVSSSRESDLRAKDSYYEFSPGTNDTSVVHDEKRNSTQVRESLGSGRPVPKDHYASTQATQGAQLKRHGYNGLNGSIKKPCNPDNHTGTTKEQRLDLKASNYSGLYHVTNSSNGGRSKLSSGKDILFEPTFLTVINVLAILGMFICLLNALLLFKIRKLITYVVSFHVTTAILGLMSCVGWTVETRAEMISQWWFWPCLSSYFFILMAPYPHMLYLVYTSRPITESNPEEELDDVTDPAPERRTLTLPSTSSRRSPSRTCIVCGASQTPIMDEFQRRADEICGISPPIDIFAPGFSMYPSSDESEGRQPLSQPVIGIDKQTADEISRFIVRPCDDVTPLVQTPEDSTYDWSPS